MQHQNAFSGDSPAAATSRTAQLQTALRQAILLRETGPKSAAWHRARMQTIWRLHRLLEAARRNELDA
ncbi:MAG: hypothetical protein EI684_12860 [Candidatus Viridilinea halotolerans]|uniref:Uncharacterized protein n=1 Tax=Candidatus Viridilinea halotolerans TaxID=2491704 RepID=A0A426TXV0_9CHLR|nr:MAG: hypothetical protein EI684_12860 [Candidatus Viridilinea halotolerans]